MAKEKPQTARIISTCHHLSSIDAAMFNFEHLDEFGASWVRLPCPEWQVNVLTLSVRQFSAEHSALG
jgi:hypothetical protein